MWEVPADFKRLDEIVVSDLLGVVGAYVIWDSQARVRPSYIGEGEILKRFSEHSLNFAMPIRGYVAVVGNLSRKYYKQDAEILEAVLLSIAERIDCFPLHNKQRGSYSAIERVFENSRVLKIQLRGHDPFQDPAQPREFREQRLIRLRSSTGLIQIDHPWRESATWTKRYI